MLHLVKKIIFTSRTCVEEWKLVVVYHLHGYLPLILWCIISLRNHIYHLHKGIPVTEKRPQKPEIGIKDGFEEMEKKNFHMEHSGTDNILLLPRFFFTETTQKGVFNLR